MELKNHFSKWCVWRLGACPTGSSKPSKIPINPYTGRAARTNDPDTFGMFEEASKVFEGGGYAGLAVLMQSGSGVVCVDIDDSLSVDGVPNEIAAWALENFKGYREISQSGRGLHFFLKAVKPEFCAVKVKREGCSLEIYSPEDVRFLCVTGRPLHKTCGDVIEEQAALDRFIERFAFKRTDQVATAPDTDEEEHSDEEILRLLRRNNKRGKITRLFAGDISDYTNIDKGNSEADAGLAAEIAFYTGDPRQVERIFNTSELAKRDKWRDRADYRKRTIRSAIDCQKAYYWDKQERATSRQQADATKAEKLTGGLVGLQLSKAGKPLSTIDNAVQILLRDHRTQGAMGFNEFAGLPEMLRPLSEVLGSGASSAIGDFQEHDITALRAWFNREWNISLTKSDAWDISILWARHGAFNPVANRLIQCDAEWDGKIRLDTWLQTYLGAETGSIGEYLRGIGRGWLIGAVARALNPGCKMDTVLILEGAQGAGKSRAARTLTEAVYGRAFVETLPSLTNSQETMRALRGAWIVELAELSSIQGRVEAEHVKAFLTTQEDTGREPYGRRYERWKRTAVFFGTTNEMEYLRDASGGRRFWAVRVGAIDIELLRKDAPQLWGEAVHAYKQGETWHIKDTQVMQQAVEQQHARLLTDSWDDLITEYVQQVAHSENIFTMLWAMHELFTLIFKGQDLHEKQQLEQRRFGAALRRCGFNSRKVHGGNMRWFLTEAKVRAVREA